MNVEKLTKMAGSVRTGGKGTMRRKKKSVHKTTATDEKRFQTTLKRIGVNAIPGIEEINIFKDYVVLQFVNPKVQASVAANTWVVSGTPQTKELHEVLPHMFDLLGPDNLQHFRNLTAEHFLAATAAEEGNGDVPELVAGETFEAAAEEGHTDTS
ncbi:basic transcription factor 3-like [Salvia hispanica]|uniref:basic transcription factor 3-like n=1 Tax=Salvia hispanica TaxID=49212 RepID=UPI0020095883|nr:basic transcription factor 3-like [Salvia hispanica]